MCSSPKSSASSAPKLRLKGFYEDMGLEKRKHFAVVANRADERSSQRKELSKRWEAKYSPHSKATGVFAWFSGLIR